MSTSTVAQRVAQLQEYIKTGRIVEAMHEFYAPDAAMQENAKPPCVGLAANIEREQKFLAGVKQWLGYEVKALAAGDNVSFVESTLEFITTGGQRVRLEQVSVHRWKDGKIVHERFYYDSAA